MRARCDDAHETNTTLNHFSKVVNRKLAVLGSVSLKPSTPTRVVTGAVRNNMDDRANAGNSAAIQAPDGGRCARGMALRVGSLGIFSVRR
jgi:hypothetical protein